MKTFKKWIFRILKVLGVIVALYLVVALFAPGSYKVERSKEMMASPEVIYSLIGDFSEWDSWSPWVEKDPTLKMTRSGDPFTKGHKSEWEGDPELSGKGSMTMTELIENEKICYDLHFVDMNMTSQGVVQIIAGEEKSTVKWWDEGDIPFLFRPMMLFMDMDGMMGVDFERGLTKLDSVATIRQEEMAFKYEIQEIDFPETNFYGIRKTIAFSELDSVFYGENYGKLGGFSALNGIEMTGMPVSICFEWNEETEKGILMPAFPVADNSIEGTDEIEAYTQPSCKALVIDYYGPYEESDAAHEQLQMYCEKNGFSASVVMEEFVTDPTNVESMDEVLTRVYYFIDQ